MSSDSAPRPVDKIDWKDFLSRHDLVWDTLPGDYNSGAFLGNGLLGSMLYFDSEKQALKLEVFRSDVQDHRDSTHGWTAYSRPRFVIGHFFIHTKTAVSGGKLRLDLWNAETTGSIKTAAGAVSFRHYIHAEREVMIFDYEVEGEEGLIWTWYPGKAITTRPGVPYTQADIEDFAERYGKHYLETLRIYEPNPGHVLRRAGDIDLCIQDLLVGGQYATGWLSADEQRAGERKRTTFIAVSKSYPEREAEKNTIAVLAAAQKTAPEELESSHRSWWHSYYPQSFLSLPDPQLESFYWIQMYKLACATRADRPMMDTSGPWFQPTPWPYITTDLYLQLCYWPVCGSNRLELGQSLVQGLKQNRQTLIENVRPVEWQEDSAYLNITCAQDLIGPRDDDMRYYDCIGNLPWTMHNVWMIWRYAMDNKLLEEVLLPLLERSVNMYLHLIEEGDDGTYHLQPTYSPEYPKNPNQDCNYDLALLRWGCKTLLDLHERLDRDHPKAERWRDVIEHLADYPRDEKGLRIGADHGFVDGHRHFSHLLMIYPLYDLSVEEEGVSDLVKKSVEIWINSGRLAGYSFTGASSLSAAMGDGNAALGFLKGLDPYIKPNTLYFEAGPVMETPLAAAQSIHDMILQSWGGTIRVFPAVSDEWSNVVFHQFRAEGAFLVSAARSGGKTRWIFIESLAGEPCRIKTDLHNGEIFVDGKPADLNVSKDGILMPELSRGGTILVRERDTSVEVKALPFPAVEHNSYGSKRY